jgi:predicted kinase
MKTLYIIRGLPGSGKTTLARTFAGSNVCEADDFFTDEDYNYKFNAANLPFAHIYCQNKCKALMEQGVENIAVSNTSSRRWEFAKYIEFAQVNGYRVVEITMTGDTYANIHQVPEVTIELMKARWER